MSTMGRSLALKADSTLNAFGIVGGPSKRFIFRNLLGCELILAPK